MADVRIRRLQELKDFRACARAQTSAWGETSVSGELLGVAGKYGGAVLGAFAGARLVGFVFALLARQQGKLIHWSHQMAVEPGWRDRGLGFRMKLAHRDYALRQGIKSICWTYDPLQSRNAALNIGRLGAHVEEYVPDCYGQFPSIIERGLPSDRFVVNWKIASAAVARRLREGPPRRLFNPPLPQVNQTRLSRKGFLENVRLDLKHDAPRLLVEIPSNTDLMRDRAHPLARRWRLEARRIFTHYAAAGYRVRDFIPPIHADGKCFYLLAK